LPALIFRISASRKLAVLRKTQLQTGVDELSDLRPDDLSTKYSFGVLYAAAFRTVSKLALDSPFASHGT